MDEAPPLSSAILEGQRVRLSDLKPREVPVTKTEGFRKDREK